jgi:hypothetical protein
MPSKDIEQIKRDAQKKLDEKREKALEQIRKVK